MLLLKIFISCYTARLINFRVFQCTNSPVTTRDLTRAFGWTSQEAFLQQDVQVKTVTQFVKKCYTICQEVLHYLSRSVTLFVKKCYTVCQEVVHYLSRGVTLFA